MCLSCKFHESTWTFCEYIYFGGGGERGIGMAHPAGFYADKSLANLIYWWLQRETTYLYFLMSLAMLLHSNTASRTLIILVIYRSVVCSHVVEVCSDIICYLVYQYIVHNMLIIIMHVHVGYTWEANIFSGIGRGDQRFRNMSTW